MTTRSRPSITTVVFDLDDTLYDCYRQRVLPAHRRACRALRAAGLDIPVRTLLRERLKLVQQERDPETLDRRLCARFGITGSRARRLSRIGRDAYFSLPVGRLQLFPAALDTLRRLHRLGVRLFILTAGNLRTQRAKVRALGLHRLPYLQAIFYTGLLRGRGKHKFLRGVLRYEPNLRRILVVGDRPDSEIRVARQLGMWTVRRLGGEFARHLDTPPHQRAHFTIRRLPEIFRLGLRFGGETRGRRS